METERCLNFCDLNERTGIYFAVRFLEKRETIEASESTKSTYLEMDRTVCVTSTRAGSPDRETRTLVFGYNTESRGPIVLKLFYNFINMSTQYSQPANCQTEFSYTPPPPIPMLVPLGATASALANFVPIPGTAGVVNGLLAKQLKKYWSNEYGYTGPIGERLS